MNANDIKTLKADAAHARKEGTLDVSTAPVWDEVVSTYGTGAKGNDLSRADILKTVLEACDEWKNTPQKGKDGKRTTFGNVVQRFGARFDAAVKRAMPETDKPVVLRASLSGEGGGSTTIESDHPLYSAIVAMIRGEQDEQAA